jgi:hypothetical protein
LVKPSKKPIIVPGLLLIMMFTFDPCISQSDIYLQHKYKPNRQKKIDFNHAYTIQTIDSTYYKARVSVYSKDTLALYSEYANHVSKILIKEVIYVEKVKKFHGFEVIATFGIIGLTISPIIWATEGNDAALEMLQASGALLAVSVPFIALREIGRKKDTMNKWVINII